MRNNAILKVGVLIEHRGRLLLIRERRLQDGSYRWNIIKGTVDPRKDRNLWSAAIRESREEAGAAVTIKYLMNVVCLFKNNQHFIQFNFAAKLKHSTWKPWRRQSAAHRHDNGRREDIIEARLFSKDELKKMRRRDLMGNRAYIALQGWLRRESLPNNSLKIAEHY